MDKKTMGIIVIVCLTAIEIMALSQGIDGVLLSSILAGIGTICGSIFGFTIGFKKGGG